MTPTLEHSYARCEAIARQHAANFYPAFRILPPRQRLGMCALYAFMRLADDYSDDDAPLEQKRHQLRTWRDGLHAALRGTYTHEIFEALHHTIETFRVPPEYLEAVLDGVEMDLEPHTYRTFADLRTYCYRVASAVGLACIHIWGFTDPRALQHAEDAGLAFQLTNILRDLGEDARRDRVYLPAEDLERFGYDVSGLKEGRQGPAFEALMKFEIARARSLYDASWPLLGYLRPAGRAVFFMMAKTYRSLLGEIERRNYDVFSERVKVSRARKLWFALRSVPVRLGVW